MESYENKVFISYAWGVEREEIVNQIEQSLQERGLKIVRDKNELGFKGSIKEFMERIGQGNCVIVVVSDKYLKSDNCMLELVEIAENKQFRNRIFPIVLADADIYDPVKRSEYVKYWETKRAELADAMKKLDPAHLQGLREDIDNYDRFRDEISGLATILKDMNTLTPEMHQNSDFKELYDAIEKRINSPENNEQIVGKDEDLSTEKSTPLVKLKKFDGLGTDSLESNEHLITFGRGNHNMVIIEHPQISWEHGQLILQEGAYRYRHLSRSTITTINSLVKRSVQTIQPGDTSDYPLFNKDQLIFGNDLATYEVSYNLADDDQIFIPTEQPPE